MRAVTVSESELEDETCPTCHGNGYVAMHLAGGGMYEDTCPSCEGCGYYG